MHTQGYHLEVRAGTVTMATGINRAGEGKERETAKEVPYDHIHVKVGSR